MGKIVRAYDSSAISPQLLGVLLTAGCADVALALAKNPNAPHLGSSQQAAIKAAAGHWQDTVQAALAAHQRSIYYPQYDFLHLNARKALVLRPAGPGCL